MYFCVPVWDCKGSIKFSKKKEEKMSFQSVFCGGRDPVLIPSVFHTLSHSLTYTHFHSLHLFAAESNAVQISHLHIDLCLHTVVSKHRYILQVFSVDSSATFETIQKQKDSNNTFGS